uniref:Zinc finger protein RFP-like n=1 Tax=Salvator merianae TaxID=96440 RepID=A0A8D0BTV8_SALMN
MDFSELEIHTICSICLEYFKDPVTVDCGHNFCQVCITRCLEEAEGKPSCPQCRETISQRNFRPNRQLTNLVELIKNLQQEIQEEEKRGVCGKHQEPLKLFCKEDRICICVVCDRSKEHKDHNVLPLEEAFKEYKVSLYVAVKANQEFPVPERPWTFCRFLYLFPQVHLKNEKEKFLSAFEQLQKALAENKRACLSWLNDVEEKMKENREENMAELTNQIFDLDCLIMAITEKCQQPAIEFLQVQKMEPFSPFLRPQLTASSKNSDFLPLGFLSPAVSVTLDPDTAHPCLFISEDRSSVKKEDCDQKLPLKPGRFDTMWCVLGCEKFTAGRHYWVVEIKGKQAGWVIGVAQETVKRKGYINFSPEEGIWAIQCCFCKIDNLPQFRISSLTSPLQTIISQSWKLSKIRVSLDYEAGYVAFSDACTGRSIFTFSSACFVEKRVCPFFPPVQLCPFLGEKSSCLIQ